MDLEKEKGEGNNIKLLEAVSSGIGTVLEWTWKTYKEFCNTIGISEWTIILAAITLLIAIIGINIYKAKH